MGERHTGSLPFFGHVSSNSRAADLGFGRKRTAHRASAAWGTMSWHAWGGYWDSMMTQAYQSAPAPAPHRYSWSPRVAPDVCCFSLTPPLVCSSWSQRLGMDECRAEVPIHAEGEFHLFAIAHSFRKAEKQRLGHSSFMNMSWRGRPSSARGGAVIRCGALEYGLGRRGEKGESGMDTVAQSVGMGQVCVSYVFRRYALSSWWAANPGGDTGTGVGSVRVCL
ncbi:hypothetical protein DFH08DRAFT_101059 [Mycena albidolilacea]|uniref:Uncharacterized protein n=1 Tax=Mycena albidolilacea TaxID=1033008 RepID=A0AAD7A916_9AGAR|nr:hypothetical protein DFH08DRAFT_101059 [Mycena albidolilacea]